MQTRLLHTPAKLRFLLFLFIGYGAVLACTPEAETPGEAAAEETPAAPEPNTLTEAEEAAGWMLLFDGETTQGWRGYNRETFPTKGWAVDDGRLTVLKSGAEEEGFGGDVITEAQFENFELSIEFMVTDTANSGIFYLVQEQEEAAIWHNAPEFQVLDDETYLAMGTMDMNKHLTGDNYDLHASTVRAAKPVGEWNEVRILVNQGQVEHWLNGQKTVEYELWTPEWDSLVAASKFSEYPGYGQARQGHIGLQDHGHTVWYRNIKIRPITP